MSVFDYSEADHEEHRIQVAYMSLADGMLLREWQDWRDEAIVKDKSSLSAETVNMTRIMEDTFAIGFSFIAELRSMTAAHFIHGDPHSSNIFVPIMGIGEKRIDKRWTRIEMLSAFNSRFYINCEANRCAIKFIDAGTSKMSLDDDCSVRLESMNREIGKIREMMLSLFRPVCSYFGLRENDAKRIFPHVSREKMRAVIEGIQLNNHPDILLALYEIGTMAVLKALYITYMNYYSSEPQYTVPEDIQELNGLLDEATIVNDVFAFEHLFNNLLMGKITDEKNRPYVMDNKVLKIMPDK